MPTIHVNIDDQGECLAVVATLINQGYEVRIDIDEVPSRGNARARIDASQARAKVFNDQRDAETAEKQRKDIERIVKAAKAATQYESDRNYVGHADETFDGGVALVASPDRQQVMDVRWAEAQAARVVECSSCGAKVDYPCVTPQGKAYGAFVHTARIQAQRTAVGS